MSLESRRAEILRRKDTLADLRDEVRDYVRLSPQERDALLQHTARLAALMLQDRLDPLQSADDRDPLSESSRRIWRRLMDDHRRARTTH